MQGNSAGPRLTLRVDEFQRMMRARGCETASSQAEELGVYVSTITRAVAGQVQPSGAFVARACFALGVAPGELFEVTTAERSAA